jgi:hypothetical protein
MTMDAPKTLAEMSIRELESLKEDAYVAFREAERNLDAMPMGDPRWPDMYDSRRGLWLHYARIDDELWVRGA